MDNLVTYKMNTQESDIKDLLNDNTNISYIYYCTHFESGIFNRYLKITASFLSQEVDLNGYIINNFNISCSKTIYLNSINDLDKESKIKLISKIENVANKSIEELTFGRIKG